MKQLSTILIFIVVISACQKQPAATFTTDKTEYYAGDTIHLTNTSENGHSYIWTMPDGSKQTTENAFYVVDTSVLYEKLTFQLEAISKHHRKKDSFTKQVLAVLKPNVSENCAYFGSEGICKAVMTSSKGFNPLNIFSEIYTGSSTFTFKISIDASLINYSGIYELKDGSYEIKDYLARVTYSKAVPDYSPPGGSDYSYNVFSGKMVIYKSIYGWHAIINNAQAIRYPNNQVVNVSTNVIFRIIN